MRNRCCSCCCCCCLHALAGLTYCAIGSLTFLDRLAAGTTKISPLLTPGTTQFELLLRWLVARQTADLGESGSDNDDEQPPPSEEQFDARYVDELPPIEPPSEESLQWAGFNGRANKAADTCYSFWNTATLAVSRRASHCYHLRQNALTRLDAGPAFSGRCGPEPPIPPGQNPAYCRGVWEGGWRATRYAHTRHRIGAC